MAINEHLKLSLIHIPKTAGVAIQQSLSMKPLGHYNWCFYKQNFPYFYRISVVRNPYDRFVSSVFFAKQNISHIDYQMVHDKSFDEILEIFKRYPKKFKHQSFDSQHKFIAFRHDIKVDFLLKYENLKDDFKTLCSKFNVNVRLVRLNKSNHKPWQYYFNTPFKRSIVYRAYERDFKLFNYEL